MKARNLIVTIAAAATISTTPAFASDFSFSLGLNLWPAQVQTVAYAPARVVIQEEPEFLPLPELGFSAAIGTPYDIFSVGATYYLNQGNVWYRSRAYNGPWVSVSYNSLPHQVRRYPVERIRVIREVEYRRHGHRNHHDNGRHRGWEAERGHGRGYEHLADNRRWDKRDERWERNERRWRHERDDD